MSPYRQPVILPYFGACVLPMLRLPFWHVSISTTGYSSVLRRMRVANAALDVLACLHIDNRLFFRTSAHACCQCCACRSGMSPYRQPVILPYFGACVLPMLRLTFWHVSIS